MAVVGLAYLWLFAVWAALAMLAWWERRRFYGAVFAAEDDRHRATKLTAAEETAAAVRLAALTSDLRHAPLDTDGGGSGQTPCCPLRCPAHCAVQCWRRNAVCVALAPTWVCTCGRMLASSGAPPCSKRQRLAGDEGASSHAPPAVSGYPRRVLAVMYLVTGGGVALGIIAVLMLLRQHGYGELPRTGQLWDPEDLFCPGADRPSAGPGTNSSDLLLFTTTTTTTTTVTTTTTTNTTLATASGFEWNGTAVGSGSHFEGGRGASVGLCVVKGVRVAGIYDGLWAYALAGEILV
jgi:hypothetical protein